MFRVGKDAFASNSITGTVLDDFTSQARAADTRNRSSSLARRKILFFIVLPIDDSPL